MSTSENMFIHPVAVRYFLYQAEALLKAQRKRVQYDLTSLERYFKDFEAQNFEVPRSDEPGNTALWAAKKQPLKEKVTRKPGAEKRDLAEAFVTYQQRINELGYALVFSAVLEDALVYVRGMIDSFQKFFTSFRSNLDRLDRDVARERSKYDDLRGSTTRYFLATSDSLDAMYAQMPFSGGVTILTPGLSEKIYGKVRDTVAHELTHIWHYLDWDRRVMAELYGEGFRLFVDRYPLRDGGVIGFASPFKVSRPL